MTAIDLVEITNRALQSFGSRTTVASLGENSNEAKQSSLVIERLRDELIRMAPWNCVRNYAYLNFITAAQGTPENPTNTFTAWAKGLPSPPWAYEYQYPTDCIRPLWVLPQFSTGFGGGVPITTAVTGGIPTFWTGPPVKFQVGIDQFYSATSLAIANGGSGHAVGDVLTLAAPASGLGAPAQVLVTTVAAGVITAALLVTSIFNETFAGSYFSIPANPIAQASSTGTGTGATFNLTFASQPPQINQRIILTNQENAILCYLKRITDPNVMDELFIEAWVAVLASRLALQLTGDKQLANLKIGEVNSKIIIARTADGNEGLTVNDVTPDWIRARGIAYPAWEFSPNVQFDWGPMFTPYG